MVYFVIFIAAEMLLAENKKKIAMISKTKTRNN